ncbi:MAG: YbhB/YbcL family Raf kinase inhibitor-like protein [Thermoleophilia bacterium]|nr:YbhB/YbcL family Raf kinase inhibitor-like protein [Thermoleophilia bacterium]
MSRAVASAAVVAAAVFATGCGGGETRTAPADELGPAGQWVAVLTLTSTAFVGGDPIPARHSCDDADLSPGLAWSGLPEGTASLALLVDDPDAPGGSFTHWLAWDLDPAAGELPEGAAALADGRNGFGGRGYRGPCPPRGGPHQYLFRLYALDAPLSLEPGADKAAFQAALAGHVLGAGELTGTYER